MDYSEPFRSSSPFKMGNSMDRLERLFSKKKHAAGAGRSSPSAHRHRSMAHQSSNMTISTFAMEPATAASIVASSDLHFPQPSFIRPRASRMVPREDTAFYPRSALPMGDRALSIPDSEISEHSEHSAASSSSSQSPRSASHAYSISRVPAGKAGRRAGSRVFNRRNTTHDAYQWLAASAEPFTNRLARSASSSSDASASFPRIPNRSSSLRDRRDASLTSLANVEVPQLHYSTSTSFSSGEISPATNMHSLPSPSVATPMSATAPTSHLAPRLKLDLEELQDLQPLFLQTRLDTPPPSDHEMAVNAKGQFVLPPPLPLLPSATIVPQSQKKQKQKHTRQQQPTPEASPKMANSEVSASFMETPLLQRSSYIANTDFKDTNKALPPSPATRRKMRSSLRRPISMRYTAPADPVPATASTPVLREPNLGDFLSLSDDDIAETAAAAAGAAGEAADKNTAKEAVQEQRANPVTPPLQQEPQQMPQEIQIPRPASASSASSMSPPVSPTSVSSRRRTVLRRSDAAPSLPPTFQAPSPPVSASSTSSTAMQSSLTAAFARPQSLAGQARMAAAFEIARIASQYSFDLAYIATIWPKNMAILHSSAANASTASIASSSSSSLVSPPSPTSPRTPRARSASRTSVRSSRYSHQGSPAPMSPNRAGLEAQFLAAYGLATVQAPYSLSAPTHAKILNNTTSRWLEFHNHELDDKEKHQQPGDFATGYGCAFYPGHAPVMTNMTAAQKQKLRHQQSRKMSTSSSISATSDVDFCCDADTELDDLDEEVIVEEEDGTTADNGRTTPRPASSRRASHSHHHHMHQHLQNNRGIVFVAYRREEADPAQTRVDLDALYHDVEALVDKILDVHMQQQRQSQLELARQQQQQQEQRLTRHYHHHHQSSAATIVPERALLADEDIVVPRSPASPGKRLRSSSLASHHGTHLRMSRNMGVKVF